MSNPKKVSDPSVLAQLNAPTKVTNPALLAQLNAGSGDDENLLQKVMRYGLKDPAIGFLNMGREFANLPHKLSGGRIPEGSPSDYDFGSLLGVEHPEAADKLIQFGAQYLPSMAIPGANIGRAGSAITTALPKFGPKIAEGISQAIPQALYGSTQTKNPLEGAAEGAAGGFLGPYVAKFIESLRPSNLLRGSLTPEQLRRNLHITRGTETSLGRVLDNPSMMRLFENILPHVIGSGAEKSMLRNAENIRNMMQFPTAPENFGETIRSALQHSAQEVQAQKTANFGRVNELAEQHGVTTPRNNMRTEAQRILAESGTDPHLSQLMDAGDRRFLESLADPEHIGDYSLRNTDILKGKMGEHAREAAANSQHPKVSIYNRLRNALARDSDEAIQNSSSSELRDAHTEAMNHYRNEVVPFEDPDIVKFTRKGGDPDLILSHFLKGGSNDRATLLNKMLTKLDPETINHVRSAYFSKAINDEGQFNPIKFRALYNKLSQNPNQFRALYPEPELRQSLKDFADLIHKNAESYGLMFNPKTGARNTEGLIKGLSLKAGQIGGAGIAHSLAWPLIAGATLGKGATKLLTSEKVRESLINKMIRNQPIVGDRGKKALGLASQAAITRGSDSKQKPMILELMKEIGLD